MGTSEIHAFCKSPRITLLYSAQYALVLRMLNSVHIVSK